MVVLFPDLRLQMLEMSDSEQPHLVKAMYSLLMLLPQTAAYSLLRDRLSCIPSPQLMPNSNKPRINFTSSSSKSKMAAGDEAKLCKWVSNLPFLRYPNTESLKEVVCLFQWNFRIWQHSRRVRGRKLWRHWLWRPSGGLQGRQRLPRWHSEQYLFFS